MIAYSKFEESLNFYRYFVALRIAVELEILAEVSGKDKLTSEVFSSRILNQKNDNQIGEHYLFTSVGVLIFVIFFVEKFI